MSMSEMHYLVGPNGLIRFTVAGKSVCGPRFARVGIDIAAIRTEAQYKAAWDVVNGNELENLDDDMVSRWPDSQPYRALKDCIFGDGEVEDLIRLVKEFESRDTVELCLKVVPKEPHQ